MIINDNRDYKHYAAEWGWITCRSIVWEAAIQQFALGHDTEANLLREIVNKRLVIQATTFKSSPREHCEEGCTCGVNLPEGKEEKPANVLEFPAKLMPSIDGAFE